MKALVKFYPFYLILFIGIILWGCTPEKARALRTAAVQFKVEAFAAINAIDRMAKQETAAPPRTETEATEEFVKNILDLEVEQEISPEIIDMAIDPYKVQGTPDELDAQNNFINKLRQQYYTFSRIFNEIEGGSFLAGQAVEKSGKYVEALTIQMIAFAESISLNPPQLLQHQTSLITTIDNVRKDIRLTADEKRKRLSELKEQWKQLRKNENELQRFTIEQCLKAAVIGKEVRHLIETYSDLSLDDIHDIITHALDIAGNLTGKDLSALKIKSNQIYTDIKEDPIWTDVADSILGEMNEMRSSKGGSS